jgi:hypothetical protein
MNTMILTRRKKQTPAERMAETADDLLQFIENRRDRVREIVASYSASSTDMKRVAEQVAPSTKGDNGNA